MATPDAIQVFCGPGGENSQGAGNDQMHAKPERLVLARLGCGHARSDYRKTADEQKSDPDQRARKPHCQVIAVKAHRRPRKNTICL